MTVGEAITNIGTLKPHTYSDDVVAGWLTEVDRKLWIEVISWHENTALTEEYDADGNLITDMPEPGPYVPPDDESEPPIEDVELLIPTPYDEAYLQYCAAKIDYWNGEYGRYNNAMAMFNRLIEDYGNYYNRTYMPKQPEKQEI